MTVQRPEINPRPISTHWSEIEERIRRTASAALDELSVDRAERRYDELQILGGELRQALLELIRSVPRASSPLTALDACIAAVDYTRELLEEAGDDAARAALDIEPDVADLVTLLAKLRVADRLQAAAVRPTAEDAGVTPGYISELRRAKKGLPSADIAARLDERVAAPEGEPTLLELVMQAKTDRESLLRQRRARRNVTVSGISIPVDLRGRDRLTALADVLRQDEPLQRTVELLAGLSIRERRAVARLVEELAES